jgi:hypothetical protein
MTDLQRGRGLGERRSVSPLVLSSTGELTPRSSLHQVETRSSNLFEFPTAVLQ